MAPLPIYGAAGTPFTIDNAASAIYTRIDL